VWSVRTGMELSRPDLSCLTFGRARPASGGRLRLIVRMRATSLLISEAARVRTALIYRPDGGPTEAIYIPQIAAHSILPHKILLFGSL
jgi:hypothetical protein